MYVHADRGLRDVAIRHEEIGAVNRKDARPGAGGLNPERHPPMSRDMAGYRVTVMSTGLIFCAAAALAGPSDPLLLTRDGNDLEFHWTLDPAATGYDVRRVDSPALIPSIRIQTPHLTVGPLPAFPVVDADGVASPPDLYFYDVSPCGDSDGDRLDDCVETNTGIFVSLADTGTDPALADSDGDALEDGDEILGTLAGLDLPALGASPVHKDVFIEYDWFDDDVDCAAHSHRPTQAMVDRVTAAFANAPVANPDLTTGIRVHHDFGQGAPFVDGNYIADADAVLTGGVNGLDFQAYKLANFDSRRQRYFHYCLLPHRYNLTSGSSGQAEINGNDFIVSLYCAFTTANVANTIVHEIGHNFNLRHGGFENCNYKPNYNSVMNYEYQFLGVDDNCSPPGNGVLDYSHGTRIDLDENNLDENAGTCGTVAWDWDGDSDIETGVVYDINGTCGLPLTVLRDHDDWANMRFTGLADGDFAPGPVEIVDCDNRPPGF